MAERSWVQGEIREVDREDEGAWVDRHGSVSLRTLVATAWSGAEIGLCCSMAVGLGVSSREWEELKRSVDDSFWVLRVIGIASTNSLLVIER